MIRSVLLGFLFLSSATFAQNPYMKFPGGYYLGEGKYKISNGATGTYASFIDIGSDIWVVSYVRHGQPLMYSLEVEFDDLGFFDAIITDHGPDGMSEEDHFGGGYCGTKQCHLSFDLGDRYIEETITL